MSLIEELGARLDSLATDLPVGEVMTALDRFREGSALLGHVRQESSRPLGVPELSVAVDHLEHAGRALLVARDCLATYLAEIGMIGYAGRPPDGTRAPALDQPTGRPGHEPGAVDAPPLERWWVRRVAVLTDGSVEGGASPVEVTPLQLLRTVARRSGAADRDGLRRELAGASPPAGLGLAAVAPPVLHRLAGELLGHPPRAEDLPELSRAVNGPVRGLLPGLPAQTLDTLLARVCRVPAASVSHPADSAVGSGVIVGVLLQRLGRDPDTLDPDAPPAAEQHAGTAR